MFLVDAKSGKVIYTRKLANSPLLSGVQSGEENPVLLKENAEELVESSPVDLETVEQLLYIMRTDYALQHYSPKTGKILWNVTVAEFDASFRFPTIEDEHGKYKGHLNSPLFHQLKPAILRIRDHKLMESPSVFDRLDERLPLSLPDEGLSHPHQKRLPLPAHNHYLPSLAYSQIPVPSDGQELLALPVSEFEDSGILGTHDRSFGKRNITSVATETIGTFYQQYLIQVLPILLFILGSIFCFVAFRKQHPPLSKVAEAYKVQTGVPRKKRPRRLGNSKSSVNNEKNSKYISNENNSGVSNGLTRIEGGERKPLPTLNDIVDGHLNGRRIGKLLVSNKEIAKGSNGTIVLEGIYDGRPVAVKRLVQTHHDVALKEIQNLIASDQHPNIVRWHGVEYDQDFVYLSLERCTCSLNDLIFFHSASFQHQTITKDQDSQFSKEYTIQLHSMMEKNAGIELWKADGYPTHQLLKLMRDVVSGLAHLHELGIIHRDLKPQNVLISRDRSVGAKLSDMGISKRLIGDKSSITQHVTGYGSSGWQAPEQLLHQRQTRAVDLFSLGCVLFFCVTGGKHPYGNNYERDANIVNDRKDLFLVENMPEAVDLFNHLLHPNPDLRPKARDVWHHPFFWSSEIRLSFLREASDRVELEDRENGSKLLNALESTATVAFNGKWDEKLESAFIDNIGSYRRYKFNSVRDLLRVIRNKLNHYRELPQEIKEILGPVPGGFDSYFSSRFPKLLIEVYRVMYDYCKEEEFFRKYIESNLI
ncbi:serine/threonine-protein kinase/endoribonuclease IRE1b isoform X2 [Ziziphus jujuba]|nr:serine/threonine-protein kinase/endoribonuclease IRE1b isoform X2 [Ziziphus jujuba]